LVVEPDTSLTGLEKTPKILNPSCPHIFTSFSYQNLLKDIGRKEKEVMSM
jgi:hypothetical protein